MPHCIHQRHRRRAAHQASLRLTPFNMILHDTWYSVSPVRRDFKTHPPDIPLPPIFLWRENVLVPQSGRVSSITAGSPAPRQQRLHGGSAAILHRTLRLYRALVLATPTTRISNYCAHIPFPAPGRQYSGLHAADRPVRRLIRRSRWKTSST